MNDYSLFYSWQTDTPSSCGKSFSRSALNQAVKKINGDLSVEEAPRVDSGMEGVAGSPDVATVMFDKIGESSIFVGDATLVGRIEGADIDFSDPIKRTTNPNVAIEMGLAAGLLSWGRIICVMNEHYGKREDMPFDVRNRRFPIDYNLSPADSADPVKKRKVKAGLERDLRKALGSVDDESLRKVDVAVRRLDLRCLNIMAIYKDNPFFAVPDPSSRPFVDSEKFNTAAIRLIEIGLLRADYDGDGNYAYHWTYLGRKVLESKFSTNQKG